MKPKVFVINKSLHDFSQAEQYGDLVFLAKGRMSRYATNNIHRKFWETLKDSKADDYLLLTALNTMNVIAANILVLLHGQINLLIHVPSTNTYKIRRLDYSNFIEQPTYCKDAELIPLTGKCTFCRKHEQLSHVSK